MQIGLTVNVAVQIDSNLPEQETTFFPESLDTQSLSDRNFAYKLYPQCQILPASLSPTMEEPPAHEIKRPRTFKTSNPVPIWRWWDHFQVQISFWNPVEDSWEPHNAGDIRLNLAGKRLSLVRYLDFKESSKDGVFQRRDHIALSSLMWRTSRSAKLNAYLERFEVATQISRKKLTEIEKYKSVFYFKLPNNGILKRAKDGVIPDELSGAVSKAFEALAQIQERIENTSWLLGPTWMRLESKGAVPARNPVFDVLLSPGSRYQLLEQLRLPWGGDFPFLSNQGSDKTGEYQENPEAEQDRSPEVRESTFVEENKPTGIEDPCARNVSKEEDPVSKPKPAKDTEDLTGTNEDFKEKKFDSVPIPKDEPPTEEEEALLARLKDIERELELLREKQVLMKRLEDIKKSRAKETST
ncbi:hypothetical protein AA313_de0209274 [Arthrobotrys entomopaga]|nr:hypothetical protein AA313_de0209274 [Arthrobotrys entomopaga]